MFKHYLIKTTNYFRLYVLLAKTLIKKECYLGPFVGEFGHLLSHIVPFVSFLSSKGVKVHLCGPKIHKPFFKNENGSVIYESYHELRDFYSEVTPHCNDPLYPVDVQNDINLFISKSKISGSVFWNLLNRSLYWDGFCTWMYHNKFLKIYKFKNSVEKHSYSKPCVVIFSRKKGSHSKVRGADWDYNELISKIKDHCHQITILGHPAFSHTFDKKKKVKVLITSNNEVILNECRKANFIINQLSGTHYLGVYLDTAVLLLMKGLYDNSNVLKDSKYRRALNSKYDLSLIENYEQLLKTLKNYEKKSD